MKLSFAALTRVAGRRMVGASAGAPAVLLTHASMEGALKDPKLLYEAMRFTVEAMGLDTFCLIADMSLEAEACGCQLRFSDGDIPMVVSHPLQGSDDPEALGVPDPHQDGRMPVFLETMRRIKRDYTMLRLAVVTGPFTLATHLRGAEIYLDTAMDPERAKLILEYCTKVATAYSEALIEAGADIIILAEPAGSQLSAAAYDQFSQAYSRRIISAMARPCILHICGKAGHIVEKMWESGAAGISVDDVDLPSLIHRAPRHVVIVGNIGTLTLVSSSPEEIRAKAVAMLDSGRDRKEFIAAPGCDLAPDTPLENIQVFVQTVKAYHGSYSGQSPSGR
jgi:uroporphyrinogen decarboxylase